MVATSEVLQIGMSDADYNTHFSLCTESIWLEYLVRHNSVRRLLSAVEFDL